MMDSVLCLSIIVPIYNGENYLIECLDSLDNQETEIEYEVILVDDGSNDNSLEICQKYVQEHLRFHIVHQENGGVASARNHGIQVARAKWITFVDCDDYVENNYVQTLCENIPQKMQDMVCFGYQVVYNNGSKVINMPNVKEVTFALGKSILDGLGSDGLLSVSYAKIYSKQFIVENLLWFEEGVSTGEDLGFNCRYLKYINSCVFVPYTGYIWKRRDVISAVNSYKSNMQELVKKSIQYVQEVYGYYDYENSKHRSNLILDTSIAGILNLYRADCDFTTKKKIENIERYFSMIDEDVIINSSRGDFISKLVIRNKEKNKSKKLYYELQILFFMKNHFKSVYLWFRSKFLFKNR